VLYGKIGRLCLRCVVGEGLGSNLHRGWLSIQYWKAGGIWIARRSLLPFFDRRHEDDLDSHLPFPSEVKGNALEVKR
jgi:hypothetical protein